MFNLPSVMYNNNNIVGTLNLENNWANIHELAHIRNVVHVPKVSWVCSHGTYIVKCPTIIVIYGGLRYGPH